MSDVTTVGIDLAKNVFSVHGIDAEGSVRLRRSVSRAKLPELIATAAVPDRHGSVLRRARVGATLRAARASGAVDGTEVRGALPQKWQERRQRCRSDLRGGHPSEHAVVPVKSLEQQADLCLHRVRQGFIEERTASINRLRGLLAEFGHVIAQRAIEVRRQVPPLLERLPARAARCVADLLEHVRELETKIAAYEREIEGHARQKCPRPTGSGTSGRGRDHRLRNRRQRRRCDGVLQRAAIRRLVGARATTVLERRQDAPRPHHATRRRLSAHAARDGRALGAATRLAQP